jgi:hypothetical protein
LQVAGDVGEVVAIGTVGAGGTATAVTAVLTSAQFIHGEVFYTGSTTAVDELDAGPDGTQLAESAYQLEVGEAAGADETVVTILAALGAAEALAGEGISVSPGPAGKATHQVVGVAGGAAAETLSAIGVSGLLDVSDLALAGIASPRTVNIATVAISRAELAYAGGGRGGQVHEGSEALDAGQ